jgi:hypothetical protein
MAVVALAAKPKTRIQSTRKYGIVSFFCMTYILSGFDGNKAVFLPDDCSTGIALRPRNAYALGHAQLV